MKIVTQEKLEKKNFRKMPTQERRHRRKENILRMYNSPEE